MKIALVSDLDAWRAKAKARVEQHFNDVALRTLHRDLVQIANGTMTIVGSAVAGAVLQRDMERRDLLLRIDDARTPAQIKEILSTL